MFRVALRRLITVPFYNAVVAILYLCSEKRQLVRRFISPDSRMCDLTCAILTSSPLLRVRLRYASRSFVTSTRFALFRLCVGTVRPVAIFIAYVLSTTKVT